MGWQYCFEVRAHDRGGNVSPWSAPQCIARALDDTAFTATTSGWWRPHRQPRYFDSTFASTNRSGATLARRSVSAGRIAVLATTCPTCGAVRIYLAGHYVGTVSLARSWHTHAYVFLRPFAHRKGTLTIRSVRGGHLVRIDGVVVMR
jgi:hypothetical protein